MNYEEAKEYKMELEEKNGADSASLNNFEKSNMGTVPDHIRESLEFKKAKQEFDNSFAELRNFNGWFTKTFKKEIQSNRRNRFSVSSK